MRTAATKKPAPAKPQLSAAIPPKQSSFAGRFTLRVEEVARALSVSGRHVIDLIEEGKLRAINIGGENPSGRKFYRIPVEAYRDYLRASETVAEKEETGSSPALRNPGRRAA